MASLINGKSSELYCFFCPLKSSGKKRGQVHEELRLAEDLVGYLEGILAGVFQDLEEVQDRLVAYRVVRVGGVYLDQRASVNFHGCWISVLWLGWRILLSRVNFLLLLCNLGVVLDVGQNHVVDPKLVELVVLVGDLVEVAGRAEIQTEALLDLENDFGDVLDPLLVRHIYLKIHQEHRQHWSQIGVEILLRRAVPGHSLDDLENAVLDLRLEEVHLLEDDSDGATFQNSWWILLRDFIKGFDACLR